MDILSKFSLPNYLKGKSFSEASKAIQAKFNGRTDPESMATMSELMERLQSAQEFVKKKEQEMRDQVSQDEAQQAMLTGSDPMQQQPGMGDPSQQQTQQQMEQQRAQSMDPMHQTDPMQQQMFSGMPQQQMQQQAAMQGQGQMMNPMQQQMQQGMPQEAMMQQQGQANQFGGGGFAESVAGKGFQKGASGSEFAGSVGAVAGAGSALMDMGKQAFGKPNIDTSGATAPPDVPSPGGSAASGAMKGAAAGASFGPWGAAIGGVLGGVSGLIGGGKAKRAAARAEMNYTGKLHHEAIDGYAKKGGQLEYSSSYKKGGGLEYSSSYKNGGKMLANMYHEGGHAHPHKLYNGVTQDQVDPYMKEIIELTGIKDFDATNSEHVEALQTKLLKPGGDVNPRYISGKENTYINDGGENSVNNKGVDGMFGIDTFNAVRQIGSSAIKAKPVKNVGTAQDNSLMPMSITTTTEKTRGKAKPLEYLRYAPAAMNALQLAQLKRPEQIGLNRLGNKYINQRVDERGLQNSVQEAVANNRDAILSSAGGSGSAARASLLASQKVGGDAMSKAYMQATELNRNDSRMGQNFDLGVDKVNLQQANQETGLNLEQQAAYRTNKSKLMSQLGNDLGNIGREELFKRYPEMMGLDYRWRGNYNPTGNNTSTTNTSTVPVNTTTTNRSRGLVQNQNQDPTVLKTEDDKNPIFRKGVFSKTGMSNPKLARFVESDDNFVESDNNLNKKGGYLSRMSSLEEMIDPVSKIFPKKKKKKSAKKATKKRY